MHILDRIESAPTVLLIQLAWALHHDLLSPQPLNLGIIIKVEAPPSSSSDEIQIWKVLQWRYLQLIQDYAICKAPDDPSSDLPIRVLHGLTTPPGILVTSRAGVF